MKRTRTFLLNTVVLTASSLIMRLIAMGFNVYLSGKTGESGLGLLQLIMTVYMLAITVASAGVRLASTRMAVDCISVGRDGIKAVMTRCVLYALFFGSFAAVLLYGLSDIISEKIIGNGATALSLKILAFSLPFISMSSAVCGYFSAVRKIVGMSVVSFLEQIIKIAVTVLLLNRVNAITPENACNAVVIGSCFSEVCSFLMLAFLYVLKWDNSNKKTCSSGTVKKIMSIAMPDACSAIVRNFLVSAEHFLIPFGLKKRGAQVADALGSYGLVSGMALPVITFASVLTSSISGLIVPEIAEFSALGAQRRTDGLANKSFRLTLIFSVFCSGVLFYYSNELGLAIYDSRQVGGFIKALAPVIPIMYLDTTVDGFLKGGGHQLASMRYNIIDAFISVVLVFFLVPKIGIYGYIVTIYVTEIINFILSVGKLNTFAGVKIDILGYILKPIYCTAGAVCIPKLILYFAGCSMSAKAVCFLCIPAALFVYFISLILIEGITVRDIKWVKKLFFVKKQPA